jgi:DNA polymerase-3 subunit delta'
MSAPYPWQEDEWTQVQRQVNQHKLPHALLLSGRPGLAKLHFTKCFTGGLLCSRPNKHGEACRQCKNCNLFIADSHPDLHGIAPEELSHQIKVDQIRALNDFLMLSCQAARYKIGLIAQADALNRHAANSLLKTLEEPPAGSLIILVTSHPTNLPATIKSRCQQIVFKPPPRPLGVAWLLEELPAAKDQALLLTLAHGEPLTAANLVRNEQLKLRRRVYTDLIQFLQGKLCAVTVASRWSDADLRQILDWLLSWLMDTVRLQFDVSTDNLNNPDFHQELDSLSHRVVLRCLFRLLDEMFETKRRLDGALNDQLLLEDVLLAWRSVWHSN